MCTHILKKPLGANAGPAKNDCHKFKKKKSNSVTSVVFSQI